MEKLTHAIPTEYNNFNNKDNKLLKYVSVMDNGVVVLSKHAIDKSLEATLQNPNNIYNYKFPSVFDTLLFPLWIGFNFDLTQRKNAVCFEVAKVDDENFNKIYNQISRDKDSSFSPLQIILISWEIKFSTIRLANNSLKFQTLVLSDFAKTKISFYYGEISSSVKLASIYTGHVISGKSSEQNSL